jgi:hypothetical protein
MLFMFQGSRIVVRGQGYGSSQRDAAFRLLSRFRRSGSCTPGLRFRTVTLGDMLKLW